MTGFKYIGEKIEEWEKTPKKHNYVFGAEESCGYLFGTFVRDKDAFSSSCLIAEAAAKAKKEGMNLKDRLYQIYQKYGVHREKLSNFAFGESEEGMKQMEDLMRRLRGNPPQSIDGKKVILVEDYLLGIEGLPIADALRLWLEDQTKLVIRPSGTEPKVKLYIEVTEKGKSDIPSQIKNCEARLSSLSKFFQTQILSSFR